MITFILKLNDDISYDEAMTYIAFKQLTFSKGDFDGYSNLEVQGSVEDYKFFENEIANKKIFGTIQETVNF